MEEAKNLLLVLEKKCRLANDFHTLKETCLHMVRLCREKNDWAKLNSTLMVINKRRAQSKLAIGGVVEEAMKYDAIRGVMKSATEQPSKARKPFVRAILFRLIYFVVFRTRSRMAVRPSNHAIQASVEPPSTGGGSGKKSTSTQPPAASTICSNGGSDEAGDDVEAEVVVEVEVEAEGAATIPTSTCCSSRPTNPALASSSRPPCVPVSRCSSKGCEAFTRRNRSSSGRAQIASSKSLTADRFYF